MLWDPFEEAKPSPELYTTSETQANVHESLRNSTWQCGMDWTVLGLYAVWGSYKQSSWYTRSTQRHEISGQWDPINLSRRIYLRGFKNLYIVPQDSNLFIYEDLWSHRVLDIHFVDIIPGWINGRASRAPARGANLYGVLRHHWKNRKYGATKLQTWQNSSENYT